MKKTKTLYEKIINVVLNILIFMFGIILLISIYNGIQVKLLGKDYSDFFGYSVFEVQTGSMADAINPGDWIIVKYSANFKPNDIVTYEQKGEFITHRIIETYKGTYITKGDANLAKDEPINKNQIVGKVVKILPYFGIFRKTFFNPFVLIALIITFYLVSQVFKSDKENVKESKIGLLNKLNALIKELIDKVKTNKEKEKVVKEKKVKEIKKEEKKEEVKVVEVSKVEDNNIEEVKEEVMSEEDMDKTIFFRAVSVDKSEIDNTYLEVAENQITETPDIEEKIEEVELDDEEVIKSNLEMLQKRKNKKCNNIVEKIMFIKNEELNEIVDIINNGEKLQVNEPTIKEFLQKVYVDAKYYNYCGDINVEYNAKNMASKIGSILEEQANELIRVYKGSDKKYKDKVKKYTNIFTLIIYLEQANDVIDELKLKRELYKKKITKYFMAEFTDEVKLNNIVEKIIKMQRIYKGMINYSLVKLETNMFELNFNPLTFDKKIFGLDLNHNISFSKVYSDYIVDKTYTEGIIAEDKITILVSLLLAQLVKDMFSIEFNKRYILYIPESLYAKDNKFGKLIKMMDDEHIKNSVVILIKYSVLIKNKKLITKLRKEGYKFALAFDNTKEIKAKDSEIICIMDYVFMDKKNPNAKEIISAIPKEFQSNVIYEDIANKVGNFGGE